nr:ribonuclease H-like domain-containing protein [Tanacetum cinerariifolium]
MFVGFDENTCYIQDWKREKVLGTGSESGGLYLFDKNNKCSIEKSNLVMSFYVSKLLRHNKLGHAADQVLFVLKNNLSISKDTYVPMLPSSVLNGKSSFELVYKKKPNLSHLSLNDDGKDTSVVDGSLQPSTDIADSAQGIYQEGWHSATQVDNQNWSEGNLQTDNPNSSPTQLVDSLDDVQTPGLRRSTRQSMLLVKLNDYVLNSNVKYRIEKYVNYSNLKWRKPIGSKWIWIYKYKASGEVERYKATLVAKGFSQREVFDYDETFSHVVKMVTIRNEISVVRNTIVKFECIDEIIVFNDENDDLSYFMFDKVFSFLSAESEDTIFGPGTPSVIEVFLCWIFVPVFKIFTSFDLILVWGSPYLLIYIA